jgi:hypothetical protein
MCKVLNNHHTGIPAGAIYIGRGSQWGNPFRIGQDALRAGLPIGDGPPQRRSVSYLQGS